MSGVTPKRRMDRAMFNGLSEDFYRFFWEIALNNNRAFYLANAEHYRTNVYEPLCRLVDMLAPVVSNVDERISMRYGHVISRIRRDTRFTRDKSQYRDHAWLAFHPPGLRTSDCFVLYAEFSREDYGYGMGMYAPRTELMQAMRERMLARPGKFLSMVQDPGFAGRFRIQGEAYKRPHYSDVSETLRPYVNMRSLSFCFVSKELRNTMLPAFAEEIIMAFRQLGPVYRFLMGLD